jgi:polysaccharide chain length determinant protein (PEP-CTERM system associated)
MSFPPRRHEDTKNILSLCHIDLVAMSGGKNMQKIAKEIRLEDIVEIILRRRWWMIISFCFCIIIGIILAFTLPKYYQADTLVLIQPQKVPKDYVQSVVTMDIDSRIEAFSHEILSRSNLEKIMKNFNMYTEPKYKTLFVEDKIADMRKRINVALLKRDLPAGYRGYAGAYAFTISFQGKDPEKVMKVTNALASYFIDENLRFTETESKGTNTFLEEELNSIRKELAAKEEALKEYREKYMGELPEQLGSNLSMLTRIQEQLKGKETSLLDAKNKLATFMDQIKQGALLFGQGVAVTNDGRIVSDFDKPISLEQAKAMLSYLETRYTSKHPDIIRIKKIISDMEKNKQNNLDASDVAQYIPANAKLEVEQIKANINTLTTDISKLKSQIRDYEKRIDNTPKREQQLKSLERDYNNKRENYNMLLNKKLETQISINMDKSQKGERFQVLDPAMLPEKPVFPNMKMLFLLTLVAGPNIGLGLIFLLEYLDTSFRSPKDIESYLGFSVLSAVPIIADRKYIRRQKLNQVFSVVSILFSFILLSAFAVLSFVGVDQTMELLNQFLNT